MRNQEKMVPWQVHVVRDAYLLYIVYVFTEDNS